MLKIDNIWILTLMNSNNSTNYGTSIYLNHDNLSTDINSRMIFIFLTWIVRNSWCKFSKKNYTNWGVLKIQTLWGQFWTLPQTEPPTSAGRICGRWVCTACCSRRSPMRSQEDWRTQTPGSHTAECEVWEHSHPSLSPTLHVVPEHLSKEKVSVLHVSISVKNIDFTFVDELNFKVSIFFAYMYVWLEETV